MAVPQPVSWHLNNVPKNTKRALEYLSNQAWLKGTPWYLAGGTALALQVGHRLSLDLDFFLPKKDFRTATLLKHFSDATWHTDVDEDGTVYGRLCNAKVSFIAYPFFVPAQPKLRFGHVSILDKRDIAVMKIIAISQRGKKRDFVDLYWYLHHCEPLVDIILRLTKQYPTVAHDYHHIMKSLMYFQDAEIDPMPELFFKVTWLQVKKYFQREIPYVTKRILNLNS